MSGGWYITNRAALFAPAQVTIYDDIGAGGVRASALLASIGGAQEVDVRIASEGGDIFEALTIYNRLTELRRVRVTVDGLAASAASIVAMAASRGELAMAPGSRMMIHETELSASGMRAAGLQLMAGVLEGLNDEAATVYARRSGKPASYWRERMRAESWFSASQAVIEGLADYVTGSPELAAMVRAEVRASLASTRRR